MPFFESAIGRDFCTRLAIIPGVRSRDWIKIKKKVTFDLVVGGYIPGHGQREPSFGGLLLGAYDSGKLISPERSALDSRCRSWGRFPVSSFLQMSLRSSIPFQ